MTADLDQLRDLYRKSVAAFSAATGTRKSHCGLNATTSHLLIL